jgi:hypothetical protein
LNAVLSIIKRRRQRDGGKKRMRGGEEREDEEDDEYGWTYNQSSGSHYKENTTDVTSLFNGYPSEGRERKVRVKEEW